MTPYKHQTDISEQAYKILKEYGLVYLSLEERTGKTLTSILVCEKVNIEKVLIVTKKKAIIGWEETLNAYSHTKDYTVINYESIHKLTNTKYDLVILDEAHSNLAAYPKMGKRAKELKKITYNLPIVFLSATPSAQGYAQLFHQFAMTKYSPFAKYSTFYKWFKDYGIPETMWMYGRQVPKYDKVKDSVKKDCEHLFISYTRKELGFEHEPKDVLHFVELDEDTKKLYRELEKDDFIDEYGYVADTPMKKLVGLHQIEGGTLKIEEDNKVFLGNTEKIDYIKNQFGDSNEVVIFYHYKEEANLLFVNFKNARILQATSFAEGVDLSMYKTLIIYSMDFSTARYTQRRARQCNMKRLEPIDVHYMLVKNGISEQVYKTVAVNKKNFVNSYYEQGKI